jgi:hypothetical protein
MGQGEDFEMRISRRNVIIGAGGIIAASSTASYARWNGNATSALGEAQQPGVFTSEHSFDLADVLAMARGTLAQAAREKAHADV